MARIFVIVEKVYNVFVFDDIDLAKETNFSLLKKLERKIVGFNPKYYCVFHNKRKITDKEYTLDFLGYLDSDVVLVARTRWRAGLMLIGNAYERDIYLLLRQKEVLMAIWKEEQNRKKSERIEEDKRIVAEKESLKAKKGCSFKPALGKMAETDSSPINASLYAPSQIKRGSWEKIQVFLYRDSEFDEVEKKASIVDPSAKIMTYNPLDMNLSVGDAVDVKLRFFDDGFKVPQDKNRIVWQGSYKSCEFVFQVPIDSAVESVAGEAEISINGIQIGKLVFSSNVVDKEPVMLYAEAIAKPYNKIFISYSHKDKKTADIVAKTCMAQQLDYFFDRHTLKPGDDFDGKITQYIQTADLFILCWSENAAKSEYVRKEYTQAIELSELKKRPEEASLRICPFSIDPKANPPIEMAKLHFEEL